MTRKIKFNPAARRKTRRFLIQALYQWQFTADDPAVIEMQFCEDNDMHQADGDYFHELLAHIINSTDELDALFRPYLDRVISKLDPIELAILRLSSYELAKREEIPSRVVINEALELAKEFGAEGSHKYINGVLDKVAQQIRTSEFK